MEAEFRAEAEEVLAVYFKGLSAVPNLPVVDISPVRAVGLLKAPLRGGGGGPVEGFRVLLGEYFRDNPLKQPQIVLPQVAGMVFDISPAHPGLLHLVVAAPQSQAGPVTEAADIFGDLLPD